ncbi:MAG: hypothetical protein JXM79_16615 [Sedimentisphaerales bacterium]|nr:hypothetical protein [Sedimentisphaerales bacterium]
MRIQGLLILGCLCLVPGLVTAAPVEVGAGVNTASVYIEWADGFSVDFLVRFGQAESDTTTGLGLMDIIEAGTKLTTVRADYGWGVYIDGISYQGHSNEGYAGGELWWHYWENNAGSQNPWQSSMTGAAGRTIAHGDADAWIYGHGDEPPAIDVVEVGSGVNQAGVFIEWSDGFTAEFLVHFGSSELDTTTGLGLMDIIEAETELTTVRDDLGWGVYIDGISYQRHSDAGYAGGELWWHYWEDNAGSRTPWQSSMTGASGRIVAHGDADGWIYGHGNEPAPASVNPFLAGYGHYVYNPDDFATSCIAYNPNGMYNDWLTGEPFNDPNAALGRPTVDTSGDDWFIPMDMNAPVVPVYPPFRAYELVYLGEGGSITLSFNHPVRDDGENPYGIDFIVFAHPYQIIGGGEGWTNGNPRSVTVGPSGGIEPGIVSVSQDGQTWYTFTNDPNFMSDNPNFIKLAGDVESGPFCGGFAPTLGRVYDPCYADTSLGDWNRWWAEPTNPTLPLDPSLTYASLDGMSIARISETYGDSAGGVGYDLARLDLPADPDTGMKWFQYIRIDDAPGGGSTEIDAVADVSCPGDYQHPKPVGDLNGDYQVNEDDVAIVEGYMDQTVTDSSNPAAVADINGDGNVDQTDLDTVIANLGVCA